MIIKVGKREQLRVRLDSDTRLALENYVRAQGKEATVSGVVREFVKYLLGADGKYRPILVSARAYEVLHVLSKSWSRTQEQTVDQCILDIHELLENPTRKTPLIVREIQLRRAYLKKGKPEPSSLA